jgi:flavin reductase (DIM6/NTAB) family NADH-FMN oxidoreductase RutF
MRDEVLADDLTGKDPYKLLVGSVVPRPIAWVSTVSADGVRNLAPFSFFTVASSVPPMLLFSVGASGRHAGPVKDTLDNIQSTGELVVNIARAGLLEAVNTTAATVDPHVDEFAIAGLTAEPSRLVAPPRVAEAPIAMECHLERLIEGLGNYTLVIVRVLLWRFEEGLRDGTYVDMDALEPLGRLAGPRFATRLNVVELAPPAPETLQGNG